MKYFSYASKLLSRFDEVEFEHVFREQNNEANDFSQIAFGYKLTKQNFESLITIKEKLHKEVEILNTNMLTTLNWRKPLVNYLQNPNLFVDRKIKYKAKNYVILGDELYKKGVDEILLKCLGESKAYVALAEIHEGIFGSH